MNITPPTLLLSSICLVLCTIQTSCSFFEGHSQPKRIPSYEDFVTYHWKKFGYSALEEAMELDYYLNTNIEVNCAASEKITIGMPLCKALGILSARRRTAGVIQVYRGDDYVPMNQEKITVGDYSDGRALIFWVEADPSLKPKVEQEYKIVRMQLDHHWLENLMKPKEKRRVKIEEIDSF